MNGPSPRRLKRVKDLPCDMAYTPPAIWYKREEYAERVVDVYINIQLSDEDRCNIIREVARRVHEGGDEPQALLGMAVISGPEEGWIQ